MAKIICTLPVDVSLGQVPHSPGWRAELRMHYFMLGVLTVQGLFLAAFYVRLGEVRRGTSSFPW